MISSESDLREITLKRLDKIFEERGGSVGVQKEAALDYDLHPARPSKYFEDRVGRFFGRSDIRIRYVDIGERFSTIVVGLAASIYEDQEAVLFPDYIAHFKKEVLYSPVLHINHEDGKVYMNEYKANDVVRLGERAPFSTKVRKLPRLVTQGFNGILSKTNPALFDI